MIQCPCGKTCIGEISRSLKERITEQRSSIKSNDVTSPVAQHFNEKQHHISSLFLQA